MVINKKSISFKLSYLFFLGLIFLVPKKPDLFSSKRTRSLSSSLKNNDPCLQSFQNILFYRRGIQPQTYHSLLNNIRKKIDFSLAQDIFKLKGNDLENFLRTHNIFPRTSKENLVLHIRLAEVFGTNHITAKELLSGRKAAKLRAFIKKEFSSFDQKKSFNLNSIRKISHEIFKFSHQRPYTLLNSLFLNHQRLQKEMILDYLYESIVNEGFNRSTKRFFFFRQASVEKFHEKLRKKGNLKKTMTDLFRSISNAPKLFFGMSNKNIFFHQGVPESFIILAKEKGLKRAYEVFEKEVFQDLKAPRRKQLLWTYTSATLSLYWIYSVANLVASNILPEEEDKLELEISPEDAVDFMIKYWQSEMFKKTGLFYHENSDEFKQMKEGILLLSKNEFTRRFNLINDSFDPNETNEPMADIQIDRKEIVDNLMSEWLVDQEAIYGNKYSVHDLEYKAKISFYMQLTPIELKNFEKDILNKEVKDKQYYVDVIMKKWLELNKLNGLDIDINSPEYNDAYQEYYDMGIEKLIHINEEL